MYALEKKPRGGFSRDARTRITPARPLAGSLAPACLSSIQLLELTFLLHFRTAAPRTPAHRDPELARTEEDEQRGCRCRTPLKLFPENRSVAPRRP
ncbi:hypothetical protein OJAV_G00069040 [Oryzias javanicus]|uniref:Uncharacterized protein n=1 Tax=Oryzias javanicus TaxID=123683 RepID=A0A3S2PAY0_ORYJA|nr:hypothetical protein OJAV_G00069040 [Oryzias javanicus]